MANTTQVNSNSSSNYRGLGSLQTFKVILKNFDGTIPIDITSLVLDFSIYEDMFSKTLYGEVSIKDSVNLLNGEPQLGYLENQGYPIVGEEYLEVSYSIVGQDPVFRRFAVYSISQVSIDANLKARNYILKFCSEEHLLDSTTTVQKSYVSQISDMVKDILETYLKVNEAIPNGKLKKNYYIQPTRGRQQLIVPRLSPLEALDFFAGRSISEKLFDSGSYLFFENKNGFNFCDLEYLITKGKINYEKNKDLYTYYYQNPLIGSMDTHEDSGKAYKTIMKLNQKTKFDTIEKIKRGYFESETHVLDLTNRQYYKKRYTFLENYEKSVVSGDPKSNGVGYPENSLNFIKNVTQEPKEKPKILGIFSRKDNTDPGRHVKSFFIPVDGLKDDTYLDIIYASRASYMTRFSQNMYTADVWGDTSIGAGDLICIDIPEIHGMTKRPEYDKYMSGFFLVTSIHHKFTTDSYMCTYDLFKNGYSSPIMNIDTKGLVEENPNGSNEIGSAVKLDEMIKMISNVGI